MNALDFHPLPDHERRPSWRKWHSDYPQSCRSCGDEIKRGWRLMFTHTDNRYLCGTCWHEGDGVELF